MFFFLRYFSLPFSFRKYGFLNVKTKTLGISEVHTRSIRLFFNGNFPFLRLSSLYACIKLAYHPQTHSLNGIFECAKGGLKKLNWELLRPQGLRIHSESVHDTIPERKKQLLQKTYFTRKKHQQFVCARTFCVHFKTGGKLRRGENQGVVIKKRWCV